MNTEFQPSWIDELIKWENAHPEYKPFQEASYTLRQQKVKESIIPHKNQYHFMNI
mgnify:CR=1 FL=1